MANKSIFDIDSDAILSADIDLRIENARKRLNLLSKSLEEIESTKAKTPEEKEEKSNVIRQYRRRMALTREELRFAFQEKGGREKRKVEREKRRRIIERQKADREKARKAALRRSEQRRKQLEAEYAKRRKQREAKAKKRQKSIDKGFARKRYSKKKHHQIAKGLKSILSFFGPSVSSFPNRDGSVDAEVRFDLLIDLEEYLTQYAYALRSRIPPGLWITFGALYRPEKGYKRKAKAKVRDRNKRGLRSSPDFITGLPQLRFVAYGRTDDAIEGTRLGAVEMDRGIREYGYEGEYGIIRLHWNPKGVYPDRYTTD